MQSIIADAGWPIWPLLFVSIVALALIFERLLALRGSRVCPPGLAAEARRMLRGNMLDGDALVKLGQSSSAGQIVATVLANRDKPLAEIRLNAEDTGAEVAHDLQRFLPALSMIATIAPLMGLFGTVVGMIEIFAAYSPGGTDPGQLARGISVALYSTGFGILVAVPAAIAHRLFRTHVDNLMVQMERVARELIRQLDL